MAVHEIKTGREIENPLEPQTIGIGGGDGGNIGPVETRVAKLEDFAQDTRERLTRIETRLDETPTKADLANGIASMIKWVVGTAVGLGVAGITVMTFVLNHAAPKASPAASPPAIIINVPASAPQQPTPTQAPTKPQ